MKRLGVWIVIFLIVSLLQAKRLPIRTYTTADGLARDHILCIVQDSRGFLWFCTAEGLSRFDGYQFTNYHTEEGLPGNAVTDFLETRAGQYWVATTDGVARFDPKGAGASRFHRYPIGGKDKVGSAILREDGAGGIWFGPRNGQGLFYLGPQDTAFRHVDVPLADLTITALAIDRRGVMWIGTMDGLYRREPDGATRVFSTAEGLPNTSIMALMEDRDGGMWVGTRIGLMHTDTAGNSIRSYSVKDGLPGPRIESLLQTSDGRLWVGTVGGLAEWTPTHPIDGREFQAYTVEQGLSAKTVGALAEDRDGNLWIGTFGSGAMKMARNGFTTYTAADGAPQIATIMESRAGEIFISYRAKDSHFLGRFDGQKFLPIRPAWPSQITYFGWNTGQTMVQDEAGEWWIGTGQGLARFGPTASVEGLAGATPKAIYTQRDGLPGNEVFDVFEDSRHGIWIGTIGLRKEDGLAYWDRSTGKIHAFSEADGLPGKPVPTVLAEDRGGDIWVGLYHGGVARYRQGRFTQFRDGEAPGVAGSLLVDSTGRLWIGTSRCLIRVDDPTADRPHLSLYGTAQGLSSSDIDGIAEDRWGRIYAATGRGIDRFQPQSGSLGRIQRYTTADGVAPGALDLAFRDRQGSLWFSTPLGLSQFTPAVDPARVPPPVLVTGLTVGGVPQGVSDLGQSVVSGLRLPQSPLRVDYVGLGFLPGETLRYQYMLEGADHDWSPPTDQRTVIYARLAAGTYRFMVRAVAGDGALSPQPASVTFTILPPVWRSWWFLLSCGILTALFIYTLYRYRLAQMLAVANVRTRIATDLHDDIGASLSQIAILSEVAQRGNGKQAHNGTPLSEIAGISRELVDSMSDIVWAINPDHDRLSNLVYRMRRFATDLLGAHGIGLEFQSTVAERDLQIGPGMRRQIFLIFKEGVHNIVRHSEATAVDVELRRDGDEMVLRLRDNGKGFDTSAAGDGHGLSSMRRRAAALGAQLHWLSASGQGTAVTMSVRLEPAARLSVLRGRIARHFR